jgi:transcriptional regulator with XRE-family HTH domain
MKRNIQLIKNIRYLKRKEKLTTMKFSELIYVHRSTIGAWLEYRALPTTRQLCILSRKFKITIDDLVRTDISKTPIEDLKKEYNFIQCLLKL